MGVELTAEERGILRGDRGPVAAKVLRTVVRYAEALGAERLAPLTGPGHFVITCALPGIAPSLGMLDELVAAGLRTVHPFTLDPGPPLDVEAWSLNRDQARKLERMYRDQDAYSERMLRLGLRDAEACTCTPYLPEVGNIPRRGDVLAWSESACVVFANSVLGARSNRNGAVIDLLSNLVGRTPLSGLVTDEGRRAIHVVRVATAELPEPRLLGAAIGRSVLAGVPYLTGLSRWLGPVSEPATRDYLHEMGAAAATAGAVGLFHAESLTPEACDEGRALVVEGAAEETVDEGSLARVEASLGPAGGAAAAPPDRCIVGCPHLSTEQLSWWTDAVVRGLRRGGRESVAVPTTLAAAPGVLRAFAADRARSAALECSGVRLSAACPMQLFDDGLSDGDVVITDSLKLSTYTHARYHRAEDIVAIVTGAT